MSQKISLDPITRIEGHLAVKVETEGGRVTQAFVAGEMYRGFETILRGRDPLDAQQITQRICGVCPVEHGIASILAQDMAYGLVPPDNGTLMRNLIQGANFIASAITHFYLLSALDFIDVAKVLSYEGKDPALLGLKGWVGSELSSRRVGGAAPFLPRFEAQYLEDSETTMGAIKHYLDALQMRQLAHKMGALFSGKMPHAASLFPGGVTETVTAVKIAHYQGLLNQLRTFIKTCYVPDVLAVASAFPQYFDLGKGCANFLSYGVFPEPGNSTQKALLAGVLLGGKLEELAPDAISEDVGYSLFSSPSNCPPAAGQTTPAPDKAGAYSWLKAPRYRGQVVEVGPLARLLITYQKGKTGNVRTAVDGALKTLGRQPGDLLSVMGRHAARAIECDLVADRCLEWVQRLVPDQPSSIPFRIPDSGQGFGLTEAARGALGHWIEIRDRKIARYQCVVPTTWNCSPRDDRGTPGAVEQALLGTPVADEKNPVEVARVIRSFDPCIACAVH